MGGAQITAAIDGCTLPSHQATQAEARMRMPTSPFTTCLTELVPGSTWMAHVCCAGGRLGVNTKQPARRRASGECSCQEDTSAAEQGEGAGARTELYAAAEPDLYCESPMPQTHLLKRQSGSGRAHDQSALNLRPWLVPATASCNPEGTCGCILRVEVHR